MKLPPVPFWLHCFSVAASVLATAWRYDKPADHQARQWIVTLDPEKRASGQPWQAEVSATSYDRARATARERFSWDNDSFSVSPVVENYLDVRQVRITP